MANNHNLSRRAQLQRQQEMEEKQKRTNRMLAIGGGILAVMVLGIIAAFTLPALFKAQVSVTEAQQTPPNATAGHGVLLQGKAPVEGTPHVVVYMDFRCGGCKYYEEQYGPALEQLITEGKVTAEYRVAHFLDDGGGDNSKRASIAAATADAVGKYEQYVHVLFANQAKTFTNRQLSTDFAEQAGITGDDLAKFQELYNSRAMQKFAEDSHQAFYDSGLTSTPSYTIDDRVLVFIDEEKQLLIQPSADSMLSAIEKAYTKTDDPSNRVIGS